MARDRERERERAKKGREEEEREHKRELQSARKVSVFAPWTSKFEWIELTLSPHTRNGQILDLEITNASLLSINTSLERLKSAQAKEIRELRRRLRDSGHPDLSSHLSLQRARARAGAGAGSEPANGQSHLKNIGK